MQFQILTSQEDIYSLVHVPVIQHGLKSKNNSKMITEGKFIGCENRHLIKTRIIRRMSLCIIYCLQHFSSNWHLIKQILIVIK